ncbi:MAG: hypothetical protein KDG50_06325 [Chromatiales bacterium]|nr:hypothetical protein [Chromatiales bacterium]
MRNPVLSFGRRVVGVSLFLFACVAPAPPLRAEPLPPDVVPITAEPDHKIRFDNGRVRLVEARIPRGRLTKFHEHQFDAFFVFFANAAVTNEAYGGKPTTSPTPVGAAYFIPAPLGGYIHRVGAGADAAVHVSALELMVPPATDRGEPEGRFPPFELAIESARGRMYRLKLDPGESAEAFTRPAGTAIVAVSSGRSSEQRDGGPTTLWDFEPGDFRWVDTAEELTVRNDGSAPIELIEIEVF